MRKIFTLLLITILSLSVVVSLSSCGLSDLQDMINQDQEDDYSDDTGDSEDSDDSESEMELAQKKINELGKKSGYEITMTVTERGEQPNILTSGVKGNVYWCYTSYYGHDIEGKATVKKDEHTASMYEYEDEQWSFNSCVVDEKVDTLCNVASYMFNMYLFMDSPCNNPEYKKGTETVAGRSCDKYSCVKNSFGVSASYTASFDKETGCVMKWSYIYTVSGETMSTTMEVTSFKTGNQVVAPSLPDSGEDYVDNNGIIGWPTNSYTALVPNAPGKVNSSMIIYDRFSAVITEVSQAEFLNYINSLIGMDYEGEEENGYFRGVDSQGNSVEIYFFESEGSMSLNIEKSVE